MRDKIVWLLIGLFTPAIVVIAVLLGRGISAQDAPAAFEVTLMRTLRHWAVPRSARAEANPVALDAEVLEDGMAHFADHCASCHGNDGRGDTTLGRNLHPRSPDMTLAETQSLSDGELFYIIEHGVRMTGMPGWGGSEATANDSWALVHFIRHLPELTPGEIETMEALNPKTAAEIERKDAIERFLSGEDPELPHDDPHQSHEGVTP